MTTHSAKGVNVSVFAIQGRKLHKVDSDVTIPMSSMHLKNSFSEQEVSSGKLE